MSAAIHSTVHEISPRQLFDVPESLGRLAEEIVHIVGESLQPRIWSLDVRGYSLHLGCCFTADR